MVVKSGILKISKCDSKQNSNCKSNSEINAWIKDLQIDTWAIYEKVNFGNYDSKPTFRVMDKLSIHLASERETIINNVALYYNTIETEDSLLRLG